MLFAEVVQASEQVAATSSRNAKVAILAGLLREADQHELDVVAHFLSGRLRQRRTGVGWRSLGGFSAASTPSLTVSDVDAWLERLSEVAGAGSQQARQTALAALMSQATEAEQRFLGGLIVGETRQGALEGVLLQAIAQAYAVPADLVRRAATLEALGLEVGRPVLPMLASSAGSVAEALTRLGPGVEVSVETKLDGIRIQAHKLGGRVRVYSRSLDDITGRLPEVAALVATFPCDTCVLDGEALVMGDDGRPRLFQETASRSASLADPSGAVLTPFFFDLLEVDGTHVVDSPTTARYELLDALVPSAYRVGRLVTADPIAAEDFSHQALSQGHEGVVIKSLDLPYQAGRRGAGWVKVKPVHTLDLVVLAVEWGSGRRKGTLSNIHLGARDPATGGFVMLGKTFKGMTDEMLAWQTERFQELKTGDDGWVVRVRPEQVVEIAFDGIQRSTRYPGGMALRFARVVRYRDDKSADEADTIDTVRGFAR